MAASSILASTMPFIQGGASASASKAQATPTTLTPSGASQNAINIAYVFYPPAELSLLERMAASVLLTEQATTPPLILQGGSDAYEDTSDLLEPSKSALDVSA